MPELKINEEKCEVDKRRLVLDFDYRGKNYRFVHDHWDDGVNVNEYTKDGVKVSHRPELANPEDWPLFTVLKAYKHTFQAVLMPEDGDNNPIFIDRAYRHNWSFNVYFEGKAYEVGNDENRPLKKSTP